MNDSTVRSSPVIPVSLLVSSARRLIERHLGLCWISGEISSQQLSENSAGDCEVSAVLIEVIAISTRQFVTGKKPTRLFYK